MASVRAVSGPRAVWFTWVVLLACLVALTVVGCSLRLLVTRRVEDVPLLVAAVVVWLAVNKPLEGPVLLGVAEDHGVTLSDVLAVPPALLCLIVTSRAAIRWSRRRKVPSAGPGASGARRREPADPAW